MTKKPVESDGDVVLPEYGLPKKAKVGRKKYRMSVAALAARRANAEKSTGPVTDEGKANSSKNAHVHGLYAGSVISGALEKPCKSTCSQHPCELVESGETKPGGRCLDRGYMLAAFDAVHTAVLKKGTEGFQGLATLQIAGAMSVLEDLKQAIADDGVLLVEEKFDKTGKPLGFKYITHPCLPVYTKMLVDLGMTPKDFILTPKEVKAAEKGLPQESVDDIATILSNAAANLNQKK